MVNSERGNFLYGRIPDEDFHGLTQSQQNLRRIWNKTMSTITSPVFPQLLNASERERLHTFLTGLARREVSFTRSEEQLFEINGREGRFLFAQNYPFMQDIINARISFLSRPKYDIGEDDCYSRLRIVAHGESIHINTALEAQPNSVYRGNPDNWTIFWYPTEGNQRSALWGIGIEEFENSMRELVNYLGR